jgi:hypothetical protein
VVFANMSCATIRIRWNSGVSGEFLKSAEDHDGLPFVAANNLVSFDTDERVGSHPLDLLSDGGEAIDKFPMVRERDRHDIRL